MPDFLRRCEVLLGPLADWKGGGPEANALRIVADGTDNRLRVAFTSTKTLTGDPNKTDISIWNLSRDTRQAVRQSLTRVEVLAGYDTAPPELVAYGALQDAATADRQGGDIITKLVVLDGYGGMVRGAYSRSWSGGTPLAQVVADIARSMPGVTVGAVNLSGRLSAKGAAFAGTSTAQLNRLADQFGFSWSVQDGVFQAVGDRTDSGNVHSFDSDVNLISIAPTLAGAGEPMTGVELVARFDARAKPGDRCNVRSALSPNLSGSYKAQTVTLSFDSHGPATVKIQAIK